MSHGLDFILIKVDVKGGFWDSQPHPAPKIQIIPSDSIWFQQTRFNVDTKHCLSHNAHTGNYLLPKSCSTRLTAFSLLRSILLQPLFREVSQLFNRAGLTISASTVHAIQSQRDDREMGRPATRKIRPLPE